MQARVFPAPAGVILTEAEKMVLKTGFPRTCGGDPFTDDFIRGLCGFSPHLRG